jgi:DNA repair protein RecO (recombination protein O)
MRSQHVYRAEAIVLKRTDFGETDRLLTLYTAHVGKIRAIAKGIRRPTSKMAGHLELFTHSQLLIARGRNLDIVTQSETISSFLPLREDIVRTTYAHYVSEVLDKATPEHLESYPLYALLLATLERIASASRPEMAIRMYEMQLLEHLGYRPQLHTCAHCGVELRPVPNFSTEQAGGILCSECGGHGSFVSTLSVNALKVLRLLQSGNYQMASQVRLTEELGREIELHLRSALRHALEVDIKSLAFLNRVRGEIGAEQR